MAGLNALTNRGLSLANDRCRSCNRGLWPECVVDAATEPCKSSTPTVVPGAAPALAKAVGRRIFPLQFSDKTTSDHILPQWPAPCVFRRKVDLWSFVPHYPSPPPGRRYALGLQQGYINPLMQFLLIVHTTHANSGWECSTLFGFGGDDDFYLLCIGSISTKQ